MKILLRTIDHLKGGKSKVRHGRFFGKLMTKSKSPWDYGPSTHTGLKCKTIVKTIRLPQKRSNLKYNKYIGDGKLK